MSVEPIFETAGPASRVGSGLLLGGRRLIVSPHCLLRIQFRFPRSKKKRIRAKWAKREENVRYKPTAYLAPENTIYCHPLIAAKLNAAHASPNVRGEPRA